MTKKQKATKAATEPQTNDPATTIETTATVVEPEADAAPAPKPKGKKRAGKGDATLGQVFEGYLDALEKAGKSDGTIASYKMELALAGADLGLDTKLSDLTPDRVVLFIASDRVQKTRSGRAKSPLSIAKTERVLRQALVWAEGAGMVAKAPLPEHATTH